MGLEELLDIVGFIKKDEFPKMKIHNYYISYKNNKYVFLLQDNKPFFNFNLYDSDFTIHILKSDDEDDIIQELKKFFNIKLRKHKLKNLINE